MLQCVVLMTWVCSLLKEFIHDFISLLLVFNTALVHKPLNNSVGMCVSVHIIKRFQPFLTLELIKYFREFFKVWSGMADRNSKPVRIIITENSKVAT